MHYFLLPLYPAPIANLFRIYSIRDYIRDAVRSRAIGVIISFKYGAPANPSDLEPEVREPDPLPSPSSTSSTFAPLLSFLIIRRFSFLPRALLPPLKPKEGTTYYLRSSRQSWESSASSSFPPPRLLPPSLLQSTRRTTGHPPSSFAHFDAPPSACKIKISAR